jgi:hypothetical protein
VVGGKTRQPATLALWMQTVTTKECPDGGVELAKENFLQRVCLNNAAYVVTTNLCAVVARECMVAQAWHPAGTTNRKDFRPYSHPTSRSIVRI